ncbi:hypothetical protein M758_1G198100 [Ceratodon purpureus]|uniref:shikimate kinase n=1 Tax=Ceratodon purpureus TaxID=3225 RepID=A0A8T0JAB9_CERPU|nr:hypothetical protein KC19_1G222800 [Ceratodon purpureus]KAG0630701.1 hypothetical protein M758_1G198100 [Ceratodon purpureus]
MAVAVGVGVGRAVAFSSNPRCAPWKEVSSWESVVQVAVQPSTSGRALSWRVECAQPRGGRGRWEVCATRNEAARDQILVENDVGVFVSSNAVQAPDVEIDSSGAADGQALLSNFEGLLKKKSEEVVELNEGSTIFLVGMMASGKSTVGRVLADALGYSFFDSDEVIESYVGGLPVKEIFRQHSETAFRDLETRALRELSGANSLVVATGGGAVVRDGNWDYLRDGITVWLDVPVEDLARRVTTVGTESRPLLGGDCCDFEKAFSKLSKLMETREQYYDRAHCRLSFRDLASRLHLTGVDALTPTAIAVQVLEEITRILQEGVYIRPPVGY